MNLSKVNIKLFYRQPILPIAKNENEISQRNLLFQSFDFLV